MLFLFMDVSYPFFAMFWLPVMITSLIAASSGDCTAAEGECWRVISAACKVFPSWWISSVSHGVGLEDVFDILDYIYMAYLELYIVHVLYYIYGVYIYIHTIYGICVSILLTPDRKTTSNQTLWTAKVGSRNSWSPGGLFRESSGNCNR